MSHRVPSQRNISVDNPHDIALRPSPLPGWLQWVFIGGFIVAFLLSGWFALTEHWRRATVLLGGALIWLSVVRLSCDSSRVGVLAVRSRRFDALFTAALGASMVSISAFIDSLGS